MKRTINENKAWKKVYISFPLFIIALNTFTFGILKNYITIITISYLIMITCILFIFYSGYSLGWEYKRISQKETNE